MTRLPWILLLTAPLVASAALASCGGSGETSLGAGGAGTASTASHNTGGGGSGTGGGVTSNYPCAGCPAFPTGVPDCDPKVLGPAQLVYPLDGVLLPPNMNVLEVQFVPPAGATLFEVDFSNAVTHVSVESMCNQVPDVRGGASRGCGVTLPQAAWNDIANTNRDGDPVKVTVRSTVDGKCVTSSKESIAISFAKDDITGGIYYWQSAVYGGIGGKTGGIYSHDFGTFDPKPTPFYTSDLSGTCVGCHNLSRDGLRMSLGTDDPDADDEFGDVHSHLLDVASRNVLGGKNISPGFQTFTHDHTKMIATTWAKGPMGSSANLAFNVYDGDTGGLLASPMIGSSLAGTQPDLSKDDKTLIYVVPQKGTISAAGDHHFMGGSLYASPFDPAANTLGAPAEILAASGTRNYYYPTLSPNQTFIVFNDAPQDDAFYNRNARVKLLHYPPGANATPIDLKALNVADGLSNSWPRWSPVVQTYKGKKLLWVTFSSNRDYGLHLVNQADPNNPGKPYDNCYPPESPAYDQPQPLTKQGVGYENCAQPQIWMAAIVVDEDAKLDSGDRSFPAFWLPFQDVDSHNHSAQWVEQIPGGGGDGGTSDGGSCGKVGAGCDAVNLCCSDVVCCNGSCTDFSNCIK